MRKKYPTGCTIQSRDNGCSFWAKLFSKMESFSLCNTNRQRVYEAGNQYCPLNITPPRASSSIMDQNTREPPLFSKLLLEAKELRFVLLQETLPSTLFEKHPDSSHDYHGEHRSGRKPRQSCVATHPLICPVSLSVGILTFTTSPHSPNASVSWFRICNTRCTRVV
jgi:hypothetical protein